MQTLSGYSPAYSGSPASLTFPSLGMIIPSYKSDYGSPWLSNGILIHPIFSGQDQNYISRYTMPSAICSSSRLFSFYQLPLFSLIVWKRKVYTPWIILYAWDFCHPALPSSSHSLSTAHLWAEASSALSIPRPLCLSEAGIRSHISPGQARQGLLLRLPVSSLHLLEGMWPVISVFPRACYSAWHVVGVQ